MLSERDNGNGEYPEWFAFGRDQGINIYGKKLMFPYMAKDPNFFICNEPDVIFYCGYCLLCEDENELKLLRAILRSELFWYYILHTSKDYANGYKSFAKNYVKNFSIPLIDEKTKLKIIKTKSKSKLNEILLQIYGLEGIKLSV